MTDILEEENTSYLHLLPIHYRLAIWIANHLVLYTIFIFSIAAAGTYYLTV